MTQLKSFMLYLAHHQQVLFDYVLICNHIGLGGSETAEATTLINLKVVGPIRDIHVVIIMYSKKHDGRHGLGAFRPFSIPHVRGENPY